MWTSHISRSSRRKPGPRFFSRPVRLTKRERLRHFLDLQRVGRDKPVGYLPLPTITEFLRADLAEVVWRARRRGLANAFLPAHRCRIRGGALYLYHPAALRALLDSQRAAVRCSGLSANPHRFIRQIAEIWFDQEPACGVIEQAFGIAFTTRKPGSRLSPG